MDTCIPIPALRQRLAGSASAEQPLIIDVRRASAFGAASDYIAGALRRYPERLEDWVHELPRSARIAVYCVHGHEVSQSVARNLRGRGIDAGYLEHGIEGSQQVEVDTGEPHGMNLTNILHEDNRFRL